MPKRLGLAAAASVLILTLAVMAGRRLATPPPVLEAAGPRLASNQTSVPVSLYGHHFRPGNQLTLLRPDGARVQRPLEVVDSHHAYARLPAESLRLSPELAQAEFGLSVGDGPSAASLTVINDAAFVDLVALQVSEDGRTLFALSPPTDTLYAVDVGTGRVATRDAGDGPSAMARWKDERGAEWIVVVHRYQPEVWLFRAADLAAPPLRFPGPPVASAVVVEDDTAYVAEHGQDSVVALALPSGTMRWRAEVAPNPGALAVFGQRLWVGSLLAGTVDALTLDTGQRSLRTAPTSETRILGGHTEPFARYIMGGKAVRSLAAFEPGGRLFVASIGPNIGPNPDRMEVSMNGGVGVVDGAGTFLHHLGFNAGVPEALVVDSVRGRVYAADIGLGRIRVLDARKLSGTGDEPRAAALAEVPVFPPAGFPTARPPEDYGLSGRAGVELHSGPVALALGPGGSRLYVLNRFTGTVAVIDADRVTEGAASVVAQLPVAPTLNQKIRRLGQVLYFTDLGRSSMTCDACHLEGHAEGVLFEKTHPMRIYRSSTVRGARETPPYFNPASTRSIAQTVKEVGSRNRFQNPEMAPAEVEALTVFTAGVATVPNPFLGAEGAPPQSLTLPDGRVGRPRRGMDLFEHAAGCAECHPAPLFTLDQDPLTRGRFLDVGTPRLFPLRPEMQELRDVGVGTPALVGAWDVFPMLTTGSAGFGVEAGQLVITTRFPLRDVLEKFGGPKHGHTEGLSAQDRDDLLAYLMTL